MGMCTTKPKKKGNKYLITQLSACGFYPNLESFSENSEFYCLSYKISKVIENILILRV